MRQTDEIKIQIGMDFKGVVVRKASFGTYIQLTENQMGLLHSFDGGETLELGTEVSVRVVAKTDTNSILFLRLTENLEQSKEFIYTSRAVYEPQRQPITPVERPSHEEWRTLHSGGATVIHRTPFDHLETPTDKGELSEELKEWTLPYYMELNRPWIQKHSNHTDGELPLIQEKLVEDYCQIDESLVSRLLAHFNWRTRIAGAYFAAIKNYTQFEEQIGRLLLKSDLCFAATGYCIAIARFNTEQGRNFLKQYLRYYLTKPNLYFEQSFVLQTLLCLDSLNQTKHALEFRELWKGFLMSQMKDHYEETPEYITRYLEWIYEVNQLVEDSS
jgi:predicted RNA-binding protein with RPS1 domain